MSAVLVCIIQYHYSHHSFASVYFIFLITIISHVYFFLPPCIRRRRLAVVHSITISLRSQLSADGTITLDNSEIAFAASALVRMRAVNTSEDIIRLVVYGDHPENRWTTHRVRDTLAVSSVYFRTNTDSIF